MQLSLNIYLEWLKKRTKNRKIVNKVGVVGGGEGRVQGGDVHMFWSLPPNKQSAVQ